MINISWNTKILRFAICLMSLIAGMFLPLFTAGITEDGLINIFWGSVYGLGFFIVESAVGRDYNGAQGFAQALLGFLLWPSLIVVVENYLLKKIESTEDNIRWVCVSVVAISFLINVPVVHVQNIRLDTLPIFTKYIDF